MQIASVSSFLPTNERDLQAFGGMTRVGGQQRAINPVKQVESDTRISEMIGEDARHRTVRWGEDGLTDDDAEGDNDPDYVPSTPLAIPMKPNAPTDVNELVYMTSSLIALSNLTSKNARQALQDLDPGLSQTQRLDLSSQAPDCDMAAPHSEQSPLPPSELVTQSTIPLASQVDDVEMAADHPKTSTDDNTDFATSSRSTSICCLGTMVNS
jgi:hypothetical protein